MPDSNCLKDLQTKINLIEIRQKFDLKNEAFALSEEKRKYFTSINDSLRKEISDFEEIVNKILFKPYKDKEHFFNGKTDFYYYKRELSVLLQMILKTAMKFLTVRVYLGSDSHRFYLSRKTGLYAGSSSSNLFRYSSFLNLKLVFKDWRIRVYDETKKSWNNGFVYDFESVLDNKHYVNKIALKKAIKLTYKGFVFLRELEYLSEITNSLWTFLEYGDGKSNSFAVFTKRFKRVPVFKEQLDSFCMKLEKESQGMKFLSQLGHHKR